MLILVTLQRNAPAPTFPKILRMMIDIAQGLEYLHERKPRVIHRDVRRLAPLILQRHEFD